MPAETPASTADWLHEVEERTESFRLSIANKHSKIAREEIDKIAAVRATLQEHLDRLSASRRDGTETTDHDRHIAEATGAETKRIHNRVKWHLGRAKQQPLRFSNIRACKKATGKVSYECGHFREFGIGCGIGRACVGCRQRQALKRQIKFGRGRLFALKNAGDAGLLTRTRTGKVRGRIVGGRWSEKHITLTMPRDVSPGDRIKRMFDALRPFMLALQRRWRADRKFNAGVKPDFYRAFEWTPGEDGRGHPHFHIWYLGPFIDRIWLARQSSARFTSHVAEAVACPECGHEGPCHATMNELPPNYHAKAYAKMKALSLEWSSEGGCYPPRRLDLAASD